MAVPKGRIFTDADREELDALDDGTSMYARRVEHLIDEKIAKGIAEGRFTEEEAAEDLEAALRLSYALNNMESYVKYVRAVKVLRRAEKHAAGSGAYWYRLGSALIHLGKIEEAKEAADRAVAEGPSYPWGWLLLGRLCAHLGLWSEAQEAQKRGLALVPDDPEFLMLGEISSEAPISPGWNTTSSTRKPKSHCARMRSLRTIFSKKYGPATASSRIRRGLLRRKERLP